MPDQSKQRVVCVLGMHRSGTSALTRLLNLMGVHLGMESSLRVEPAADNVKGHWEHKDVALINETILQRFGGSWHEPPMMPDEWERSTALNDLRNDASQLIEEQFATFALWGWKDPRTSLTLRFWQQLVSNVHYVLCLRNPVDVASSLQHRDEFPPEKSFQLWLTYVCSALKFTDGKPRVIIFYEDIIRSPVQEMTRIAEFLGQPEAAWKRDALTTAQAFIERELQHHASSIVDTTFQSSAERSAKALYLAQRICSQVFANGNCEQLSNVLQTLKPELNQPGIERGSDAKQLVERNEIVERLWSQIEEQGRALALEAQSAAESRHDLSNELRQKELELEQIKNTTGFRILNRCWQIKHKYFRPFVGRSRSSD